MVRVRLLGEVGAVTDAGERVDVGPGKCQIVLAALALEPGAAVPVSRLVALVWGDGAPRTAERTLQSYIARIRRGLGAESIVRCGAAYRLDVDAECVDVARFERHVRDGDVAAALGEWGGAPLAALDAAGLGPAVDRLTESWLTASEADLSARAERDPASVVGPLTELTATHPYREGLWALLMVALYRTDRQADALAAFRRARRILVEDLGLEPGPRLRELEALVLDQQLDGRSPAVQHAAPHDGGLVGRDAASIPEPATHLVGRDREVAAVAAALEHRRLVTLTGPGGIGKTALAIAAVRARPRDRRVMRFVDLSALTRDDDVARAVLDAVDTTGRAGRDVLAAVADAVGGLGPSLLILDNCEQVIDGTATVAVALLDRCAQTSLLLTTRQPLDLVDERVVVVPSLGATDAVELFIERASSGGAEHREDRASVAALCSRLDGVPLALELAAARSRTLTPAQLLDRLAGDLRILDSRTRGRPRRHRTLRASVEWSHDLLEPDERAAFEQLSVFAGSFDLAAAEAVVGADEVSRIEIDDVLDRLVHQSMLLAEPAGSGLRFRLLAPMRELAAARLERREQTAAAERRHGEWCLDEVRHVGHLLRSTGEIRGVTLLQEVWADLRSAVHHAHAAGDAQQLRELIQPIAAEAFLRSRGEIGGWCEQLLEIADGDEDLVVFGLTWVARRHLRHRDVDGYRRLLRRFGEPDHVLVRHAGALVVEDHERLVDLCHEAAAHVRADGLPYLGDLYDIGRCRALLALGRLDEHDAIAETLLAPFRRDGPPTFLHWTLAMLGYSKLRQGRRTASQALFAEADAVEVPPRTHSRRSPVAVQSVLRSGDSARAFQHLRDHAADLRDRGDLYEARLLGVEVVNLVAASRPTDTARLLGYLDASGLLDIPAFAAIVRRTSDRIAQTVPEHHAFRDAGRRLDDRGALDLIATLADTLSTEAS